MIVKAEKSHVSKKGSTPLHGAAEKSNRNVVDLLISSGDNARDNVNTAPIAIPIPSLNSSSNFP